ncbi:MAG: peptidylprolyl isomerase [Bacteroidales bacterium]
MNKAIRLIASALTLTLLLPACGKKNPVVEFQTTKGNFLVELYVDKAPITAGNFRDLVKKGLFDGASFYRVVRDPSPYNPISINVVQGGIDRMESPPTVEPISHENTDQTGIRHLHGVISMARDAIGTASTEFFICIGDQPELDVRGMRNPDGQGFAAFGKVADGIKVVQAIYSGSAAGEELSPPVRIHKARIK